MTGCLLASNICKLLAGLEIKKKLLASSRDQYRQRHCVNEAIDAKLFQMSPFKYNPWAPWHNSDHFGIYIS